jgi:phenylacetic acid degradation operon negative regulatory protein
LAALSALLEALGFGDRFVRTSVFRLQKEGWLEVEKIGRRSFYRVTDQGMRQFRHAEVENLSQRTARLGREMGFAVAGKRGKGGAGTVEKRAGLAGLRPNSQQSDGGPHHTRKPTSPPCSANLTPANR